MLTLVHFSVDFCGGLTIPLPEPTLTRHLAVDIARVAVLLGAFGIVINLVQPLSGWLLPARGVPLLLALGPPAAACTALLGLTRSYFGVAALLLVAALGIGIVHPEGALAAHAVTRARRGLGMSTFMAGGYFGYATGSLVSGLWVERHGQGLAGFWLLAMPAAIVAALVLASGLHRADSHPPAPDAGPAAASAALPFAPVLGLAVAVACGMGIFTRMLPIWMVRAFPGQNAQAWAGAAVFATGVTGTIGAFLWGHLSDSWGRGRLIAGLQALAVPFLFLTLRSPAPWVVPLGAAGVGLTLGGVFPLIVLLARQARGTAHRLRLGLTIGGAWGVGELLFISAGRYLGTQPAAAPEPVARTYLLCWVALAAAIAFAATLARHERQVIRRTPDGGAPASRP